MRIATRPLTVRATKPKLIAFIILAVVRASIHHVHVVVVISTAAAAAAAAAVSTKTTTTATKDSEGHDMCSQPPPQARRLRRRLLPNIIVILTDDLDYTLGGMNASTLTETRRLISDNGKTFTNWFAQTPVCCPSRAELFIGRYFHNLRTSSSSSSSSSTLQEDVKGGMTTTTHECMHVDVDGTDPDHPFWDRYYFARYFSSSSENGLNYTVGLFGKHLNNENPTTFLPVGVDTMMINGGGTYMNPTFIHGHRRFENNNTTTADVVIETKNHTGYSTSIIGNASLAWINDQFLLHRNRSGGSSSSSISSQQQQQQQQQPIFALISVKAPHIQDADTDFPKAIPAPNYEHMTLRPNEQIAPRVPNYNYSDPTHNHHWIVRSQLPLTNEEAINVDDLYRSRLRTLQSVDDLVVDLIDLLKQHEQLDNTYVVFTSDNGYRLGQFQIPQLKLHPYENDVRVPMLIRGPNIKQSTSSDVIASHVDLIPTLLGLVSKSWSQSHTQSRETNRKNHQGQYHRSDHRQNKSTSTIPPTMDGSDLSAFVLDYDDDDDGDSSNGDTNNHNHNFGDNASTEGTVGGVNSWASSSDSSVVVQQQPPPPRSLLIEYMSLGNVRRYRHLVDTYNHTFMALRMMLPPPQMSICAPRKRSASNDHGLDHNNEVIQGGGGEEERYYRLLRYSRANNDDDDDDDTSHMLYNFKYIEFRDSRIDWNFSKPALEVELYDLTTDPFELHNLLAVSNIGTEGPNYHNLNHNISSEFIKMVKLKMHRMYHCRGDTCRKEQSTGLEATI
jgi:arylsulfatase A-like enzyme